MNTNAYNAPASTLATSVELHQLAALGPVSPASLQVGTWDSFGGEAYGEGGTVAVAMHPCVEFVVYVGPRGVYVEWADEETLGDDVVPGIYFSTDVALGMLDAVLRNTAPKLMAALNALHA